MRIAGSVLARIGMDFTYFRHSRGKTRADGPDRLIGDDRIVRARRGGNRPLQLACDHSKFLASCALGQCFADADNSDEPGAIGGLGLAAYDLVDLSVIGPAL